MLKRLFTPLTLVNQLALIVLLATIIGVAGMAISARLVNGVQGARTPLTRPVHCVCKATGCWRRSR